MDILTQLLKDLDLSPKMHARAGEIYDEITSHLEQTLSEYNPSIYPQGSFALGTVIQPVKQSDEYDLDFVCKIKNSSNMSPKELKEILKKSLEKKYKKPQLEEKNRCWRVNYDDFHIDILPAIPEDETNTVYESVVNQNLLLEPIKVPDKELSSFKPTNPKGYLSWFKSRQLEEFSKNAAILAEETERLPYRDLKRGTLQRVVQLMKRHRDLMFKDDPDNKPISIIITTLAGHSYEGEGNIIQALKNITDKMPEYINANRVLNPAHPKENFADKWKEHPERKTAFNRWLKEISSMAQALENSKDLKETYSILSHSFGESDVNKSRERLTMEVTEARKSGLLKIGTTGEVASSAGKTLQANTFYGE